MLNKYAMVVIVTLVVVAAVSSRKAPLPTALSDRWCWCCWGVASLPGLLSPAGKSAFSDMPSPLAPCSTWKSRYVPFKPFMERKGRIIILRYIAPHVPPPSSPSPWISHRRPLGCFLCCSTPFWLSSSSLPSWTAMVSLMARPPNGIQ